MNNKSLIFLAIKSLDIQNQTCATINTINLNFDDQLNQFIIDSGIQSDKDLEIIISKVLNSASHSSLYDSNLANNYQRRFLYYFKKMSFLKYMEKSIYENNILIENLGITGLYLIYLTIECKGLFKLWLYYEIYNFEQLIKLVETKNNL
ncbi:hypothetical protein (chloroplast) [Porphyra umbilicalis]|uniref:Uncharacterized protein n=1 Tax=Porphyra umbilicalis TaxID=2786 RepID=J7F6A2_PORUM|nr:hypothetical protein [Porphyra umbilicalis]AFC40018.1 hypothetical protein [Porphyra umbilicalis]ASN78822.1 hypothetical protein [Porphyra umbilicalis]|eukprot:ASN78822.1 hypothetical protein (chloroplast) [Porphyra umbilicalis]